MTGTTQMTEDEVVKRLANGENPIKLSIEKHKRLKAFLEDNPDIRITEHTLHIRSDTCAMCHTYSDFFGCSRCPLAITRVACDEPKSPWRELRFAIAFGYRDGTLKAADVMIAELEAVDRIWNRKHDVITSIDEPEEARKKTLRNILDRCDRKGYIEIGEYNDEPFVLIHDQRAVECAVKEIMTVPRADTHGIHVILPEAGYDEYGFDDEYSRCCKCGQFGKMASSDPRYGDLYVVGDSEEWCTDCIAANLDDYIESVYNEEYEALTSANVSERDMNDHGYVLVRTNVESNTLDDDTVPDVWVGLRKIDTDIELVDVRDGDNPWYTDVYAKADTISLGGIGDLYTYLSDSLESAQKVVNDESNAADMRAVYAGKVETLRFALKRAREIIAEVFEG